MNRKFIDRPYFSFLVAHDDFERGIKVEKLKLNVLSLIDPDNFSWPRLIKDIRSEHNSFFLKLNVAIGSSLSIELHE